jgi:phospholipid transport system substrate-binding protein
MTLILTPARSSVRTLASAFASAALVLGFGASVTLAPAPVAAQSARDATAEAFILKEANRGLVILDGKGAAGIRTASFHAFIDEIADVPKVTNFVLGKYARTVSPEQKAQFAVLFREYAISVYKARLGYLSSGNLTISNSLVRKPGDVIVSSVVSGGQVKSPLPVQWRVNRNAAGEWRVVDVQVSGVWLAITQQQDFVATMDNSGGRIEPLMAQLRSQTASLSADRKG